MGFFKTEEEKRAKQFLKDIRNNNVAGVTAALALGLSASEPLADGYTPLWHAARRNSKEVAVFLLGKGASVDNGGARGKTPLMEAAERGHCEIAKLLLDHGANVNLRKPEEDLTPLHYAANGARGNVIKLLLEHGADPRATDRSLKTPADLITNDYYIAMRRLIENWVPPAPEKPKAPAPAAAPPPPKAKPVATALHEGWRLTAPQEVSNVTLRPEIGYRLTEIFNFGSGIYTRIARSLETGAESQAVRFFDEFTDRTAIDRAHAALEQLGGDAGAPRGKLDKPSLPPPAQGG